MTAIAYKDGVLASDSVGFRGNLRAGNTLKIVKGSHGIAGMAGATTCCERWLRHFESMGPDGFDYAGIHEQDLDGVWVSPDGAIHYTDHLGYHVIDTPFAVAGCAGPFLMGAMAAGATAEEAVRLALIHDSGCAGDVQVLRLSDS